MPPARVKRAREAIERKTLAPAYEPVQPYCACGSCLSLLPRQQDANVPTLDLLEWRCYVCDVIVKAPRWRLL
jgi:hypothetical protein